jgi:chorismate mutase / prephenate dehydratase
MSALFASRDAPEPAPSSTPADARRAAPERASSSAADITPRAARDAGDDARDLDGIRREIEAVDRALVAALAERARLSLAAAAAKRAAGMPTLDPPREAAVVRRAAEHARELGLPADAVRDIFWHVIALCRSAQTENG